MYVCFKDIAYGTFEYRSFTLTQASSDLVLLCTALVRTASGAFYLNKLQFAADIDVDADS